MIRVSFPPPLSAFGDTRLDGTIHVDGVPPKEEVLIIAVRRSADGRRAVTTACTYALTMSAEQWGTDLLERLDRERELSEAIERLPR